MNTDHFASACPHCGARGSVHGPSPLWKLAIIPAWVTMALMVCGIALLGPMNIPLLPVVLFGGICLLSSVHARAGEEPECGSCGKIARPVASV